MDFWRRWHITLSDFMRDYVYFPLGGSRLGVARQYLNIMIIMFVMGLWHGAGWTFILWGLLHGFYIVINHLWHRLRRSLGQDLKARPPVTAGPSPIVLTFSGLVVSLAIFRADNLAAAWVMLKGMAGFNGLALSENALKMWGLGFLKPALAGWGVQVGQLLFMKGYALEWTLSCLFIVWFMPNSQEIMAEYEPALGFVRKEVPIAWKLLLWRPSPAWAGVYGLSACISVISMARPNSFLYFQF